MTWGTAGTVTTQPIAANQTWESPVITAASGRMLINLRWEGKRSPSLNIKRTIGGVAVYAHDFARLSMRQESPGVWAGTSDIPLPDMSIVAFNDGLDGVLSWSMTPWLESGGTGGSLSDADKASIAKIATLETQLSEVVTSFSEDGQELTAGETVEQGDTRTYTVAGAVFTVTNRLKTKRKVDDPIGVTELNRWIIESIIAPVIRSFPANTLIPKGFSIIHTDGSKLINRATRVTGAEIDLTQWDTEVNSLSTLNDWIANAGDDYAVGDKLLKADDRRIMVGTTPVRITYRGADKVAVAMTVAELANWEIIPNSPAISYPGAVLAPKGFIYSRSETGELLQLKDSRELPATFDRTQWETVGQGKTVREVIGGSVDALTLLDAPENAFFLNGVTVNNGPGNAAQNVSGWLYTAGDGKNGVVTLTVIGGDNVGAIGGTWSRRVTTPAPTVPVPNPPTDNGTWVRTPLAGAPTASINNGTVFTGSSIIWDLTHTIKPAFTLDGTIVLTPKTDWSTRTGSLSIQSGVLVGSLPAYGTDPIELIYSPSPISWTIVAKPLLLRAGKTVHNFGKATPTALKGLEHNLAEIHVEGGGDYTIAAADWFDGQSITFVQTAGGQTTEKLTVSGFAGAYLRDGTTRNVAGGLFLGRQDSIFRATITENGGLKYLNIVDLSRDAHAIAGYITPPAGITAGMLVNVSGATVAKANAIAPNALPATHYLDVVSGALTPLYEDGCIFKLPSSPAALSTAKAGDSLFLGADGLFSLNAPAIVVGNIRQPVAVVRPDGRGLIKLRAPATITV
jgi:hypothetical protein